jgi:hypothetical protein
MSALVPFPTQVAKSIPRLGSDHDGEVVATARAIDRRLKTAGLGFHDIADIVERGPGIYSGRDRDFFSWASTANWCREHARGRLNPKEYTFVSDMAHSIREPTEKQRVKLSDEGNTGCLLKQVNNRPDSIGRASLETPTVGQKAPGTRRRSQWKSCLKAKPRTSAARLSSSPNPVTPWPCDSVWSALRCAKGPSDHVVVAVHVNVGRRDDGTNRNHSANGRGRDHAR